MEQAVHAFFDGLSTPVLFVALAGAVAVLTRGADWLVDGAAGLSERLGVPKVIVGATIVSMGTTAPETAVSVLAAVQGMPDFALGNAVGSIICDTGLIFGLACLLTRLPTGPVHPESARYYSTRCRGAVGVRVAALLECRIGPRVF